MDKHVYVTNPPRPYVNYTSGMNNNSLNLAGTIRYDPTYGGLQVFDGSYWVTLSTSPSSIGLSPSASQAIDWAIKQMELEKEAMELAKTFPSVEAALAQMATARKQLEVIVELTKEHAS